VATTFGYGPRYLHSTGQFHKGGPSVGRFVEIVDEPQTDSPVPGEPYTFATLIRAQADGDLQTLRAHGLPAVRVGKEIL
jgi:transaldolase/glucose-6-phosphate isomerase